LLRAPVLRLLIGDGGVAAPRHRRGDPMSGTNVATSRPAHAAILGGLKALVIGVANGPLDRLGLRRGDAIAPAPRSR
jgi:hypothetical protein